MAKLKNHIDGKGIVFSVTTGTGKDEVTTKYGLRAPMPNERDDAGRIDAVAKRLERMNNPDMVELAKHPVPEEETIIFQELMDYEEEQMRAETEDEEEEALERQIKAMRASIGGRTAADSPLEEYGRNKRSRYLAKTLLIDKDGKKLDINKEEIIVQDAARDAAVKLWNELNRLPFLSDQFSERISTSS